MTMNIKKTLSAVSQYLGFTRRVGHTHTMINGIINNDKSVMVVVPTMDMGRHIKPLIKKDDSIITLTSIDNSLRGHNRPIVFDNTAIFSICTGALDEINRLERSILDLNRENCTLKSSINVLEMQSRKDDDRIKHLEDMVQEWKNMSYEGEDECALKDVIIENHIKCIMTLTSLIRDYPKP